MARALPPINSLSLVARAEQKLFQREQSAVQSDKGLDAKKERVQIVLKSAMEIVLEDSSDESIAELERAIEAAQKVGVLPQLRVQARKIMAEQQAERKRCERLGEQLSRLSTAAAAAHREHMCGVSTEELEPNKMSVSSQSSDFKAGCSRHCLLAQSKRKADQLLCQLRQAVDAARRHNLSGELLAEANSVIQSIEQSRTHEDVHWFKLKQLTNIDDPEKLEAQVLLARKRGEVTGPKAEKIVSELEARASSLRNQREYQQWLDSEIKMASGSRDAHRLRQLVDQGRTLELNVLPSTMALLHELEAEQHERLREPTSGSCSADVSTETLAVQKTPRPDTVTARLDALVHRKKEAVEKVLLYVEDDPTLKKLDEAKQAISGARGTKMPADVVAEMERRLTNIEDKFGPRLEAEEKLLQTLRTSELVTYNAVDGNEDDDPVLQDMSNIATLRKAVIGARKAGVVEDLLEAGQTLLDRSCLFEVQQRKAAEHLRDMMKNPNLDDNQLEDLHLAIDAASRSGLPTLHAERELLKLRDAQVHREVAEAELREAKKGQGAQGKARLEAAIQAAKSAGVSAQKLRAANACMENLQEHYKKCALVAGNIRRRLPTLQKEPWRFQQIVESAQALKPWTAELDKLISMATAQLDKCIKSQSQQNDLEGELQALLQRISVGRANGQTCADDTVQLAQVMARAKGTKVRSEVLQEGEMQLRALKREGCQRNVAEHRLRLALNAKDFGEIERSIREVRAFEGLNAGSHSSRGDQPNKPQSARLMDTANSMLRHLGDVTTRRQAAEHALMQRISDSEETSLEMHAAVDEQADSIVAQQGTEEWVKEMVELVHEAKQSGVAASLIEHAKLKIRQKRRERREEEEAAIALKKTLAKKDVTTQELLRSIRKVQRFYAKPATTRSECATTRP